MFRFVGSGLDSGVRLQLSQQFTTLPKPCDAGLKSGSIILQSSIDWFPIAAVILAIIDQSVPVPTQTQIKQQ